MIRKIANLLISFYNFKHYMLLLIHFLAMKTLIQAISFIIYNFHDKILYHSITITKAPSTHMKFETIKKSLFPSYYPQMETIVYVLSYKTWVKCINDELCFSVFMKNKGHETMIRLVEVVLTFGMSPNLLAFKI